MLSENIEHLVLLVGSLVSVSGAYYAGKRNKRENDENKREEKAAGREEVNELLKIKDEMIDALREDRENLKAELAEQINLNRELQKKVKELENRQSDSERDHNRALQRILEAIATSDQCLNAPSCRNRRPPSSLMPENVGIGGTD